VSDEYRILRWRCFEDRDECNEPEHVRERLCLHRAKQILRDLTAAGYLLTVQKRTGPGWFDWEDIDISTVPASDQDGKDGAAAC
jgi:hypothetical protein